jgi:hypothetical protein
VTFEVSISELIDAGVEGINGRFDEYIGIIDPGSLPSDYNDMKLFVK